MYSAFILRYMRKVGDTTNRQIPFFIFMTELKCVTYAVFMRKQHRNFVHLVQVRFKNTLNFQHTESPSFRNKLCLLIIIFTTRENVFNNYTFCKITSHTALYFGSLSICVSYNVTFSTTKSSRGSSSISSK